MRKAGRNLHSQPDFQFATGHLAEFCGVSLAGEVGLSSEFSPCSFCRRFPSTSSGTKTPWMNCSASATRFLGPVVRNKKLFSR